AKSDPAETIQEHTAALLENYHLLKEIFPDLDVDWEILRLVVLFHDIGKLNTKFQNKLYKYMKPPLPLLPDDFSNDDEIPHGNISATLLDRKAIKATFTDEDRLRILYQSVYFHHGRYIKGGRYKELQEYVKNDLPKYLCPDTFDYPFLRMEPKGDFRRYIKDEVRIDYSYAFDKTDEPEDIAKRDLFFRYVMVKGLLNRLDYAASGHVPVEVPNTGLEEKTLNFLSGDKELWPIQKFLHSHQDDNNVVVASTGSGKTEAGLLWIGNGKGFFTLPLRVSINAIHERITKEKKKDNSDEKFIGFKDTALLHSDALAYLIKKRDENNNEERDGEQQENILEQYDMARQLSMPLTITTVDQLLKFVFKAEGFERLLATLAYSKIIIDEIQMYSPELVACILVALKYIKDIGGRFTILTATFPAVFGDFMKGLGLTYNYKEYLLDKQRHTLALWDMDIMEAVQEAAEKSKTGKVLVIMNTVRKAQRFYEALGTGISKHLLHSRFIKKDRRRLENEIIDFSNNEKRKEETGIWVTTQIVEASLDIDFDYLYTELSTVDGLFQRMGRCYRKRDYTGKEPNVKVFTRSVSGVGTIIDLDIFTLSLQALKPFHNKPISEKDKMAVIKDVYSMENIKDKKYYGKIQERIRILLGLKAYKLDRAVVDQMFRNIQSYTVIPLSVYNAHLGEIAECIRELERLGFAREVKV
ncbi:MAG: CRISPR-associated helicase Cas3', partial [bacterium]|nr:CRISPR-associated helicase Cas3' [bacterium]